MVEQLHDGIVARPDPTACPDKNLLSRIPSEAMSTRQQKFSVVVAIPPAYRRPHYTRGLGGTHILKVMRHLSGFPVHGPDIHIVA